MARRQTGVLQNKIQIPKFKVISSRVLKKAFDLQEAPRPPRNRPLRMPSIILKFGRELFTSLLRDLFTEKFSENSKDAKRFLVNRFEKVPRVAPKVAALKPSKIFRRSLKFELSNLLPSKNVQLEASN